MFNNYYTRKTTVYNSGMSDSDKKEITDSINQVKSSVNDLKKSVEADTYTYKVGNVDVSTKTLTWEIILNAFGLEDRLIKSRERFPEMYAMWKLKTIAKFLNGNWKLSRNDFGYSLRKRRYDCSVTNNISISEAVRNVAFKDRESAEKAKELMGNDAMNLDIDVDYNMIDCVIDSSDFNDFSLPF